MQAKKPTSSWCLLGGLEVDIIHSGTVVRTGTVEIAASDSSAVWLSLRGVEGRMLVHKSEGFEIWADPDAVRHREAEDRQ